MNLCWVRSRAARRCVISVVGLLVILLSIPQLSNPLTAYASAYSTTVLGDSPASYWRLGESSGTSALDAAGTNTGTYTGGYTLGAAGAIAGDTDTSVSLNGSSGYVDINQAATLQPGTALSVEAWVKPSASVPDGAPAFVSPSAGSVTGYGLGFKSGHALIYVYGASGVENFAESVNLIPTGSWTYLVGTWDGSTIRLYVNGQLQASTPDSAVYYGTINTDAQIGRSGSSYFPG